MLAVSRDLILAIDNGTQSLRALLFDPGGRLLAKARIPLEPPYLSEQPGWAEQHPDTYWAALCRACRLLWQEAEAAGWPMCGRRLAGVSLTTQRGTVVNVDRDGRPLRPAILWLDQRRTYGLKRVAGCGGCCLRSPA